MSDNTSISWTDATWSPVTGCTKTSEGCTNCYIDRTPPFRMAHRRFDGPDVGATTGVKLHSDRLGIPLSWRKPRMIFVCSLADLFQDEVPDQFIADVFAVMSLARHHTFQVLTKRHARLRTLLNSPSFWLLVDRALAARAQPPLAGTVPRRLPNVWIGVSAENQRWADIRIPALLDTPAAVHWISAEPLLGPVSLRSVWLHGPARLAWVVVGGESGPKARPMDPNWARALRDQCVSAGVGFHFKQFGEWAPTGWHSAGSTDLRRQLVGPVLDESGRREVIARVGKKAAGRVLDGRTWDEPPTPPAINLALVPVA
jgi:protein gp37